MTRGGTVLLSPSAPVSGTGTGFGTLPSRERGIGGCVAGFHASSACARDAVSSYGSWQNVICIDVRSLWLMYRIGANTTADLPVSLAYSDISLARS